jgi:glycosyltransferase involved in cell wall biosynthesis
VVRVGIVADYREENWPSMDLMADMLLQHVPSATDGVTAVRIEAPFSHRVGRLTGRGEPAVTDRILNRFYDYPRWLRSQDFDVDLFHIIDHSYAHLVHALPRERTIVTCHDIDAFLSLTGAPTGSLLPKRFVRQALSGLRSAQVITCDSEATRTDLIVNGLVPEEQVVVVPLGAHPACTPAADASADARADDMLGPRDRFVDLLHVGSTVPRKRLDMVLRISAAVRSRFPELRLVRVGGPLTTEQREEAARVGMSDRLVELPFLDRDVLAAVYRRAALVLIPSDREGFGLPAVEATACGTPVIASDIPAIVEVGGNAVVFCPRGDLAAWSDATTRLLRERHEDPARWRERREACVRHGERFTWEQCGARMRAIYASVSAAVVPC